MFTGYKNFNVVTGYKKFNVVTGYKKFNKVTGYKKFNASRAIGSLMWSRVVIYNKQG